VQPRKGDAIWLPKVNTTKSKLPARLRKQVPAAYGGPHATIPEIT